MNGARVLLGVTGGIAAYKAASLTSALVQRGAIVDVVMTAGADFHDPGHNPRGVGMEVERADLQPFLDLVQAAALAGRPALEGYRLAGSGLGGAGFLDVEAQARGEVSTLGSGTRVIGVYQRP